MRRVVHVLLLVTLVAPWLLLVDVCVLTWAHLRTTRRTVRLLWDGEIF